MLLVLHSQIEEVETVAAACHILYSITHDDAIRGDHCVDIEAQLCKSFITDTCLELQREKTHVKACAATEKGGEETSLRTAVNALVMVLQWHAQRRDVTRACIRSITNLSHFSSILEMLGSLNQNEKIPPPRLVYRLALERQITKKSYSLEMNTHSLISTQTQLVAVHVALVRCAAVV